jgi:hypothetical protein
MLLTPCEKGEEKRRGVSITRRSKGARPPLCRRVGCELLIYNKIQNFISQKLKKLFEPKFQRVFLYTYTASSGNLSSLALS